MIYNALDKDSQQPELKEKISNPCLKVIFFASSYKKGK